MKGSLAPAVGLIYETLISSAQDEALTYYGLLAEAAALSRRFFLGQVSAAQGGALARRQAGDPGGRDLLDQYPEETYARCTPRITSTSSSAEKTGEREITFTFDSPGNRELPMIVGEITVLPKHWWEGSDSEGRKRDISATTLEKPLGSGPYRIKDFVAGRSVAVERVKDYWGEKLPLRVGDQ